MTKAIALSRHAIEHAKLQRIEFARSAIVLGCALALIFAGQPLPL